jgi:hypothetical protein
MSAHTLGTAAAKILNGCVTKDTIGQAVARCAWCQEPRMNRECWHADAKILLRYGLAAREVQVDYRAWRQPELTP